MYVFSLVVDYGISFLSRDTCGSKQALPSRWHCSVLLGGESIFIVFCCPLKIFRLLKDAEFRLGRRSINELTSHEFFQGVNWATLPASESAFQNDMRVTTDLNCLENPPADLHTPQFTYADPNANLQDEVSELNDTKPFAFSELFQSSLSTLR